jgi:hypothetical protein
LNLAGMVAHDRDHRTCNCGKQPDQAIQKCFASKTEERLGGSHAAGRAAGQYDSGDRTAGRHFRTAREDSVAKIDFDDYTEMIPCFAVIVLMSFTYNIGIGITGGFVLYPLFKLATGRTREVRPGLWVLCGLSLLFFVFYPYVNPVVRH